TLTVDVVMKNTVLLSFGLGVAWAEYAFFSRFWELLGQVPLGFQVLLPRFVSMVCSFFFAFLAYSSLLTTLSSLYQSTDVRILLNTPLSLFLLMAYKGFDIAVRSSITLVFLTIPAVVSIANYLSLSWAFYGVALLVVLSLVGVSVCVGMWVGMILMALFPVKRLHQTIAIIGLCLATLLITGMRFLHLETLWSGDPLENPLFSLLQESNGMMVYPGYVFSQALVTAMLGGGYGNGYIIISLILACGVVLFTLVFGRLIVLRGWFKLQDKTDSAIRAKYAPLSQRFTKLPLPRVFKVFLRKEWAVFQRDPSIWTQVFMMLPLGALYVLNLTMLPLREEALVPLFALANLGLVSLITAAIGARFLFPAASREGKAVWVVQASPLSPTIRILQKYLFSAPPVLLLAGLVLLGSCYVLELKTSLFAQVFTLGMALTIQISLMAVFMGFCFPQYNYRHLLEVSLGRGSFLFMVLAVLEVGSFVYLQWNTMTATPPFRFDFYSGYFAAWGVLWVLITLGCFEYGRRKTRYLDANI
ncbi:hypothetical protein GF373_11500, partial [bacterium]|nr:hypothetical protein [bacterium]